MPLEYEAIRKSFNTAAKKYEKNAILQKEVLGRLLERLSDEKQLDETLNPTHIVDLGCGTGWAIPALLQQFDGVKITCIDFSQNMLNKIPTNKQVKTILNDAHDLPFDDNSVDIVFSNMLLHWCNEADVFKECMRILKPGGLLLMSALGETSLVELKHAWLSVDKNCHVHDFPALHSLGDDLMHSGFEEVVVNAEIFTLTYQDVIALMKDIKASGGHNSNENRRKTMMTRNQLNQLTVGYEEFRQDDKLPASYEVVYLRAKKPNQKEGLSLTIKND